MDKILYYLLLINIFSFIVAITDKNRAVKHSWRISENAMMFLAVLGGAVGLLMGLLICNHKTRRIKFMVGIPVIILIEVIVLAVFVS